MDIHYLSTIVALLVALSVASERLVEIIKGIVPFLNHEQPDEKKECRRKAALQALAVVAGIGTTLLGSHSNEDYEAYVDLLERNRH